MSIRAMVLKRHIAALFLLSVAVTPLFAQTPPAAPAGGTPAAPHTILFAERDGMTVSFVTAPNVAGGGGSGGGPSGQWLKIELHYSVNPSGPVPYVDSAEFKITVEGRDMYAADAPGKDGVAVGLTGSVTYLNIPKGRDAYGVFYVSPATLTRYSTREGVSDFDRRFNIHVDALVGGTLVDYYDKRKEKTQDWYKALRPVAGLVYRQNECAFALADVDHYPVIKLPAPAQGQ